MIQIINVSKSYSGNILFDSVTVQINSGEKVGLVGRNGHGKTTLFRIITGEEEPDDGQIQFPKDYHAGYVSQVLSFTEKSVLAEAVIGLPESDSDQSWKAEKILSGLGFTVPMFDVDPHAISGGFQVRLNLAKTLLSEPDMLLLDEPTNYLDVTAIRWLITFLKGWKGELLLITHDRNFMDAVVTHTMAIHRKTIKKMKGNTESLYMQIAQEEEIHENQRQNLEKKQKQARVFINRFRAKARLAGMVQSRIKMLDKQEKMEKLEMVKDMDFTFRDAPFQARQMMEVAGLTFSYNDDPLIDDVSLLINKGDRIGIIGQNGKGKSTLVRLLVGDLTAASGTVRSHHAVRIGYFGQTNREQLHLSHTVLEEIALGDPTATELEARNMCGVMMFEGDDALKRISVLSGGEKSRVLLGKVLMTPCNLLVLDEPTNHLDMQSCDALLAALDRFDGAVVMVTHNEMFLHAIADRLVVFDRGKVNLVEERYSWFLDKIGWNSEDDGSKSEKNAQSRINENSGLSKKEVRKMRASLVSERSRILKPIEKRISEIDARVTMIASRKEELDKAMIEASTAGDGPGVEAVSKEHHELETSEAHLYEEYEKLLDEHETVSADFEKRLEDLGSG
jgi:ATP-binding cassette subfamily F protein 3